MTQVKNICEVAELLLDVNDGPVTEFTIIARGVELVKNSNYTGDEIGNGIYHALKDLQSAGGYIQSNERTY
jgi:hypothetical protein